MQFSGPLSQLFVAAALLTRLPLPRLPETAFSDQARTIWAWPLVGALVAALAGLSGLAALAIGLPPGIAAGLVLAVEIALTGAMHEDGLADTADGLWGGMTRERRLDIMRDSRIGTFGVLALALVLGLRWQAVALLLPIGIGPLIAAGALSRALMPVLMASLPPARNDGMARGVGRPAPPAVAMTLALGAILAFAAFGWTVLAGGIVAAAVAAGLGRLALHRIGGHTGDILGAAQQLATVLVLLGAMVLPD